MYALPSPILYDTEYHPILHSGYSTIRLACRTYIYTSHPPSILLLHLRPQQHSSNTKAQSNRPSVLSSHTPNSRASAPSHRQVEGARPASSSRPSSASSSSSSRLHSFAYPSTHSTSNHFCPRPSPKGLRQLSVASRRTSSHRSPAHSKHTDLCSY